MKRLISIIAVSLFFSLVNAQNEDYVWPIGDNGGSTLDRMIKDSILKKFWPFNFNFNVDPMKLEYKLKRKSNPRGTHSSICTKSGDLFC